MAPRGLLDAFRDQWASIPDYASDLTGKTVVVVGANVGLGYEAAKKFAKMNPGRLILACRNQVTGNEAVMSIQESTGCQTAECWTVDLANFKSISAFVDRFEKEGGGRLDVLLENAGVLMHAFEPTPDGWENTLQVNYLGTVMLALLLLPVLASTAGSSRVTIVTSEMLYYVKSVELSNSGSILEKLNDPTGMTGNKILERYNDTKLLEVFFCRELAARFKPSSAVAINSMNPGYCQSSIRRRLPYIFQLLDDIFFAVFARSTEVGSRTLVHAALWGTKEEVNGKYLNKCQVEEVSDYILSSDGAKVQKKLWEETIEVLDNADQRVKKIVDEYLLPPDSN